MLNAGDVAKRHDTAQAILNAGDGLQQVREALFVERSLLSALIGSSPARSSPRVLAPHALPLFLLAWFPALLFLDDGNS